MRATKMTSSHCRSVTPPLSRASSSDLPLPLCVSPDMTRRTLSPDLVNFNRRPISPGLEAFRPLSPDLARRSRSPARPRSLMESLLVAKMEALSTGRLVRTDSMDSCSSFGSMSSLPSDVCRCDDCLLGIVDFYMPRPEAFRKTWIRENNVVDIVLRDSLHQPQYVDRLEKMLRFMIKENSLTLDDLDAIWKAQHGKHEVIVKNLHDLLAKLAWDFTPDQLDHLFDCFKDTEMLTRLGRSSMEEGKYGEAIKKFIEVMKLYDATLKPPYRSYYDCVQDLRRCMLALGNYSIV